MIAKEPKCFADILELQKILDENIKNVRTRGLKDIQLSLIAEIIEFNEETKESHKTWKSKPYDREKELEELTDIFFFLAQWINYESGYTEGFFEEAFSMKEVLRHADCRILIYEIMNDTPYGFLLSLMTVARNYSYTKEGILETYWKKWQKNMERIGKEWN